MSDEKSTLFQRSIASSGLPAARAQANAVRAGRRRLTEVLWHEWQTLIGVTMPPLASLSNYKYIQPAWKWLDVGERDSLDILVEILGIGAPVTLGAVTGLALLLQTSLSEDGPWGPTAEFPAATNTMLKLTTDPTAQFPIGRFIRLAVQAPALTALPPWQMSFRASAFIEEGSSPLVFNEAPEDPDGLHATDWVGLRGEGSTGEADGNPTVVEPAEDWLRTDAMQYLVYQIEVMALSGATLILEGAFGEEGPWTLIAAYTAGYTLSQVAMGPMVNGAIPVIPRIVRRRVQASAGVGDHWHACFRVNSKWS